MWWVYININESFINVLWKFLIFRWYTKKLFLWLYSKFIGKIGKIWTWLWYILKLRNIKLFRKKSGTHLKIHLLLTIARSRLSCNAQRKTDGRRLEIWRQLKVDCRRPPFSVGNIEPIASVRSLISVVVSVLE